MNRRGVGAVDIALLVLLFVDNLIVGIVWSRAQPARRDRRRTDRASPCRSDRQRAARGWRRVSLTRRGTDCRSLGGESSCWWPSAPDQRNVLFVSDWRVARSSSPGSLVGGARLGGGHPASDRAGASAAVYRQGDDERPSEAAMRGPARCADGATLNVDEAAVLLAATGDDLDDLTASAARVRDGPGRRRSRRARSRTRASFHPADAPVPRSLPTARSSPCRTNWPRRAGCSSRIGRSSASPAPARAIARGNYSPGRPTWDRLAQAAAVARRARLRLTAVRATAAIRCWRTGLLPHPGTRRDVVGGDPRLKPVAPSMGMMLRTTSSPPVHREGAAAPWQPLTGPTVLYWLTDAGRLSVPFTTGILVRIRETRLEARRVDKGCQPQALGTSGVIVQNFRFKLNTAMRAVPDTDLSVPGPIAVNAATAGAGVRGRAPTTSSTRGVARRSRRDRRLGRGVC